MDLPWGTVLPVVSTVAVAVLAGWFKVTSDRVNAAKEREIAALKADADERKTERDALTAQLTARENARAQVEVARESGETTREIAADNIDLTRGATALDRIRELEARNDLLIRDVGRRDAVIAHWQDATLEVARYARSLEDGFNQDRSDRVAELLLGTQPDGAELTTPVPAPTLIPLAPIVPPVAAPSPSAPVIELTAGPVPLPNRPLH